MMSMRGAKHKLRDYQEEAADFIYAVDRSMVLAPVGAGKTATCLVAMEAYRKAGLVRRWLVVAPRRVTQVVWPAETPKWSDLSIAVALGTPAQRLAALASDSDVVAINYENLQWLAERMPDLAAHFDGVVFDELTRLKNPSGKRFKAFVKAVTNVNIRIGLTGSFTSNGLEDVFGQCHIIDQKLLGRTKGAFLQQYFWCANREIGEWMARPGALQQVMARIKPATYVLEPGIYTNTLPPLHVVRIPVQGSDEFYKRYKAMRDKFVMELANDVVISATSAAAVTSKLQQLANGWVYETHISAGDATGQMDVARTPHWVSAHKYDALDEILEENQHRPHLIWYWFREDLAELQRRYPQARTLDSPNVIAEWDAGRVPLLLIHPMSGGHGLNLQSQQYMVFLSLPWSLELYEQAIGRLHRSGQQSDVWCYILQTDKTIDERIAQALQDKTDLSHIAVDVLKNS